MKILVSACLLGSPCKYSGGDNLCLPLLELARNHTLIPLRNGRIVTQSGGDVTHAYEKGAGEIARLARLLDVKAAILKSRSPACGCGAIYDGSFSHTLIPGNGLAAEALLALGIPVYTEENFPEFLDEKGETLHDSR